MRVKNFSFSTRVKTYQKLFYECMHTDNMVTNIYWKSLLCWAPCLFWMHCPPFCNNLWSRGFCHLWYRRGSSDPPHLGNEWSRIWPHRRLQLSVFPTTALFKTWQDTRQELNATKFFSLQSVTLHSILFLLINPPSPRILRRKFKNHFFKILDHSLITVQSSSLGLQKLW